MIFKRDGKSKDEIILAKCEYGKDIAQSILLIKRMAEAREKFTREMPEEILEEMLNIHSCGDTMFIKAPL